MKIAVMPEPDQIGELMKGPADSPVVMLNLLTFKERAEGEEGTGLEAYARYGVRMREIVEAAGGRFLFMGRVDSQVIGHSDERFDAVALVEYPSRQDFVKVASSAEVQKIGVHRAAGLEGQWLIATTEGPISGGDVG